MPELTARQAQALEHIRGHRQPRSCDNACLGAALGKGFGRVAAALVNRGLVTKTYIGDTVLYVAT